MAKIIEPEGNTNERGAVCTLPLKQEGFVSSCIIHLAHTRTIMTTKIGVRLRNTGKLFLVQYIYLGARQRAWQVHC